ncbi:MAG: hypothetical protein RBT65_09285 [Methanolobus sp.]|nr:hypothetical protein [Methanolobus sp.]
MRLIPLALILLFVFILSSTGFDPIAFVTMALVVIIVISFTTLNVTIDENYLGIKFGFGIF